MRTGRVVVLVAVVVGPEVVAQRHLVVVLYRRHVIIVDGRLHVVRVGPVELLLLVDVHGWWWQATSQGGGAHWQDASH